MLKLSFPINQILSSAVSVSYAGTISVGDNV